MKFSSMSVAVIAAGLLAGAPAFAQTTPATPAPKKAPTTVHKQKTDGEGPSGQLFSQKQKAQSLSHSDPAVVDSSLKQK
jgi:hypothetical protein